MSFFSGITLASARAKCGTLLNQLAGVLVYERDTFQTACDNGDAQKVNDVLTQNLLRLTNTTSVRAALAELAQKFPELPVDLGAPTERSVLLSFGPVITRMIEQGRNAT